MVLSLKLPKKFKLIPNYGEIDADIAQEVIILPPFGQQYIYYILGIAVAIILIVGISITIMVVRKKK